jgi:anti-sigma factor RsiW
VIDWEAQLKIQAFLDGELPEAEARQVSESLARDPEAAALAAELRQTGALLAGLEEGIKLPESREFFWSKVERGIERIEQPAPAAAGIQWATLLRRLFVPASAVAVLAIAGFVATHPGGAPGLSGGAEVESAMADSGTFTYRDYNSGTTLVWLSYPAENEVGQ